MIESVSTEKITFNELPYKFEDGTPHIVGAVGLGVALDYIQSIGFDAISAHEQHLMELIEDTLFGIKRVKVIGERGTHLGAISVVVDGIHVSDISEYLDNRNIAIRVGNHCAQPLVNALGYQTTARVSIGLYNNEDDILAFGDALRNSLGFFSSL